MPDTGANWICLSHPTDQKQLRSRNKVHHKRTNKSGLYDLDSYATFSHLNIQECRYKYSLEEVTVVQFKSVNFKIA